MKQMIALMLSLCIALGASENPMKLIAGSAGKELAIKVGAILDAPLCKTENARFNDGELNLQIQENVRGHDVFIVQPSCKTQGCSVNDNLMELILMVRAAKRASASSITAVIPYYGYARQDRKCKPRVPISAADVAMLIEKSGVVRVVAVDLHCGQIQGFFRHVPVDNLYGSVSFLPYFANKGLVNPVVVSPDAGGVKRAKTFRDGLAKLGVEADFAIVVKQRTRPGEVGQTDLVGSVEGCDVIIVDDLVDTAGTLCKAAGELQAAGARNVYACITHPVLSGPAYERVANSVITELVVADTIPLRDGAPDNIVQVSVAPLVAETIRRIHSSESVSALF